MTRKIQPLEDKDDQEVDFITFDFSEGLSPGETITSVMAIECEVRVGTDTNPQAMVVGVASLVTPKVAQLIGGGIAGNTYVVRCEALTSNQRVLVLPVSLRVVHL
jgi:hypothetical protein